jgi:hypothetical protein
MPSITLTKITTLTREEVIDHAETFNCQVFRKIEISVGTPPKSELTFMWVGNGYAIAEPSPSSPGELCFRIEAEEEPGDPGYFDAEKGDVMYLLLSPDIDSAKLAFEIVDIETTSNIPPFTQRYIANRRDDLHVAAGSLSG